MGQSAAQTIQQLVDTCESLASDLPEGHYSRFSEQVGSVAEGLRALLKRERGKPSAQEFFQLQERLLVELQEVKSLISLSIDQQCPMTRAEVQGYLSITASQLARLENLKGFPRIRKAAPGIPGWYRKHEVDTWLFSLAKSQGVDPRSKSASKRQEVVSIMADKVRRSNRIDFVWSGDDG